MTDRPTSGPAVPAPATPRGAVADRHRGPLARAVVDAIPTAPSGEDPPVPYLARLLTYPVKSLDGQAVPAARVLASGALADDRRFALHDGHGKVVNAKRFASVHALRSTFDADARTLAVCRGAAGRPACFHLDRDRPALEAWLAAFFSFPVSVHENAAAGFPDDTDSPGPTVISTATLAAVAGWFPGTTVEQMRARLRANVEVGGVPAFWEDRLYGPAGRPVRFRIGDVRLDGINPCQRCNVPPRDPATGEAYPDFVATFRRRREQTLPPWAERSRFDHFYRLAVNTCLAAAEAGKHLRVGDPVTVEPAVGTAAEPAAGLPAEAPTGTAAEAGAVAAGTL